MPPRGRWYRFFAQLAAVAERVSWAGLVSTMVALYAVGWMLLDWLEPPDSGFSSWSNYSWWFLVTVTTVGYGDLAPATAAGRTVAAVTMILGIGTMGVTLGKFGELVLSMGTRRRRGMANLSERDHIVIFGYRDRETQRIVEEIRGDPLWASRSVVLCSHDQGENPMPDAVKFVRGDLNADETLERACVADASLIIIQRRDDMQTIVTAIAVQAANPAAHVVAGIEDPDNEKHLRRVSPRIECVVPLQVPLIVQALQDPGTTHLLRALVSNLSDDVVYRLEVPESAGAVGFGQLLGHLKQRHAAILLAVDPSGAGDPGADTSRLDINPPSDYEVRAGMSLYYVSERRIDPVDWPAT